MSRPRLRLVEQSELPDKLRTEHTLLFADYCLGSKPKVANPYILAFGMTNPEGQNRLFGKVIIKYA